MHQNLASIHKMHLFKNINLISCILFLGLLRESVCEDNLKQYLSDRFEFINWVLDNRNVSKRGINGIEVMDEKTITVPDAFENLVTFESSNKTYLMNDDSIFEFISKKYSIEYVTRVNVSRPGNNIAFIRTMEYNNEGIMFVAYKNKISSIYGYSKISNNYYIIQSIQNPNHLTDAKFFFNNGSLYLTISSMYGVSLAPISIFKWMGTHFDKVAEELISGTIQLETFKIEDSEIIVFIRNVGVEKSNSYVYEFKMDTLRKIQILDSYMPTKVKAFIEGDETYLIITDEMQKSTIYFWSTGELVPINYFQTTGGVSEVVIIKEIDYTIIFIIYTDKLAMYTMYLNELIHVKTHFFQEVFNRVLKALVPEDQTTEIKEMLIFGYNTQSKFTITRTTFRIGETTIVGEPQPSNNLIECMNELEGSLEDSVDGISSLEYRAKKILKTNEPLEYEGRLNVAEPVLAQFAKIENPRDDINSINFQIKEIENKIDQLASIIMNLLNAEAMIIDKKLTILGGIKAVNLKAQKTQMENINGILWNPQEWLTYSKKQTISAPLTINKMFVKRLNQNNNGIFHDIFLKSGNQKITAPFTCNALVSSKIYTQSINGIQLHKIYVKSQPKIITGEKIFDNILAKDVQLDLLNKNNISQIIKLYTEPKASKYEFPPSIKIKNLIVKDINNVNWDDFSKNVFKIGVSHKIEGNLNFKILGTNSLTTDLFSGVSVNNLLTVSSNQLINSRISFGTVNAKEVNCKTINGINLQEDVAYFDNNKNVMINGPTILKSGKIRGTLNRGGALDNWNVTLESYSQDSLRIFNKKVLIKGDLLIKNINMPETIKLFVSGNKFNQEILNEYWQKSTNQVIPTHFEAVMGITVPQLSTEYLNEIPIDNYMINNLDDKMSSTYIFQNATVIGDITIQEHRIHTPNLIQLADDAIETNGTFVIKGFKNFTGKLSVDYLKVDTINSVPTTSVSSNYPNKISGKISFKNLKVKGNADAFNISTKVINGINLMELYNKTLFINEDIVEESMDFMHVTAENMLSTKINSKSFSKYQNTISKLKSLNNINLVKIRGNAIINNFKKVDYINNISVSNKIKKFQEGNPYDQIEGNVIFQGKVQVKHLTVKNINKIDLINVFPRILSRNLPQNITAKYTFKIITTENLITPMINNINVLNLIDTQTKIPQTISIRTIKLSKPFFSKSLFTNYLVCDLIKAFKSLHHIPVRYWKRITIFGDAAFLNSESDIGNLISNSVRNNKGNINVNSLVTLKHVHADEVIARGRINDIYLENIIEDALLVTGETQVISGFKHFNSIKTAFAQIRGNIEIPSINRLDILKINNSTLSKQDINNTTIKGRKTFFGGLQVNQILASTAAGILPENLVSLKNLQLIPNATFDTLIVQDSLNINFANGENFDEFINNRLLLNSPQEQVVSAVCFFEEIELKGPASVTTLNDINVNEIVFDDSVNIITAPKVFKYNMNIIGDVIIDDLNGFPINETYSNAIILGESANIISDICLKDASKINGNIIADQINYIPLDSLKDQLKTQNGQIRANIVRETIKSTEALIDESIAIIQRLPDQYLYLEKSDLLHIEVPNSVDANIANIEDNLMIHIQTEDSGDFCGLPIECTCPSQFTFVLSPGYSVNKIDNKNTERVFSYQDQDVSIHVVTNSWSRSHNCRTNALVSYEVTKLTWTAHARMNISQAIFPNKINGYVSDVDFFSYGHQVYVVIGRFYDPHLNTHNMETLVIRFCKLKGTINIVQQIPTTAAWKIHTFYTAQGINLVIGNKGTSTSLINSESTIDIYRFNTKTSLFDLIRNVPSTGCLSITSLVFGYDSLIIIAQVDAPMEVLKYDHTYDNFHFYQNMLEKYPVVSVSSFYTGEIGRSDANLLAVGDNGELYVFSYQFFSGWKLESESRIEGLRNVVPFTFNKTPYVLATSINGSSVLTVVKHGHN